jgi:hypothetical protein
MATMSAPTTSAREPVLQAVRNNEFRPLDLLTYLAHKGFDEADIKQAISELLHEGKIELTSHRMLKIISEVAA